jgi:hypothetical protein
MCVEKTTLVKGSFFLFLGRIWYTKLVNIMSLSGTHHKKEPFSHKGSSQATISALCSFLYIVDMTEFSLQVVEEMMHKKRTFYTYACTGKYSISSKNVLKFVRIRLSYALYV